MLSILIIFGYVGLFLIMSIFGNHFCRFIFDIFKVQKDPNPEVGLDANTESKTPDSPAIRAGRVIGFLERTLIFVGILLKSWEILVAVMTLKTFARYKELDKQLTAEYFLIGSFVSIAWTVFWGGVILYFDYQWGFYIASDIRRLLS